MRKRLARRAKAVYSTCSVPKSTIDFQFSPKAVLKCVIMKSLSQVAGNLRKMSKIVIGIVTFLSTLVVLSLSGCGLRIPPIDEAGDQVEAQRFVQAVVFNINCELRRAFADLHDNAPDGTFLDNW